MARSVMVRRMAEDFLLFHNRLPNVPVRQDHIPVHMAGRRNPGRRDSGLKVLDKPSVFRRGRNGRIVFHRANPFIMASAFFPRHWMSTHSRRRITMMGRTTFWYSQALNLPRNRSADFHVSADRLSSLGLFKAIDIG
jgi:hypothetical protein